MASNPMQKKSRNSFLLGMLLMLIIAAVIIVIMFLVLTKNNKKQEEVQSAQTYVYKLRQDVKSGETISSSMVESVLVNSDAVPTGAASAKTKSTGKDGKEVWTDKLFSYNGYKSKIDLTKGTIISESMLYEGEELQDSERIQEYNMLKLPMQLEQGDYVDIRLQTSSGQDFIVASHKEVIDISLETIWLQMKEDETLLMSNAIVDAYISPATNLYIAKYVEPGDQKAATVTYVPSDAVRRSIIDNPNIVKEAREALDVLYKTPISEGVTYRDYYRAWINNELSEFEEDKIKNIQEQMVASREKAKAAREEFLVGIN